MKKVSARQIIVFYFIYSFAIKFLMLPHLLTETAGRDAWIAAVLGSLIELSFLCIILVSMAADKDRDVYQGLRSPYLAKPVLTLLFAFFLLQLLITLKHANFLLKNTLYENFSVHMYLIPMLILGIFFCYMKTRAVFRSGEIFYILIIAAIFLAVVPSLWKADAKEVLPILSGGLKPALLAAYNNLVYFEAPLVLLVFKGEVDIKKGFARNFMLWAAAGAVVFAAFIFFYYSLFGPLADLRTLGIVDITGQNSYISQGGRLEWIIVCIWLLLLMIRFGVLFYCCFALARYVTHLHKLQPAAIVFPLAIGIYALYLLVSLNRILSTLRPFIVGFYILIPLLFLAVTLLLKGGKKNV